MKGELLAGILFIKFYFCCRVKAEPQFIFVPESPSLITSSSLHLIDLEISIFFFKSDEMTIW